MASRSRFLDAVASLFRPASRRSPVPVSRPAARPGGGVAVVDEPGRWGDGRTFEVEPPAAKDLRIVYTPETDGDPDAGEVVWTWVPYDENDGRGKDRPVLVIGRAEGERVYAVRLTSKAHDGDRDYLPIGSGPWDGRGRPSWVDIEQIYSVHPTGMRREASALHLDTFVKVASALHARYGWTVGN